MSSQIPHALLLVRSDRTGRIMSSILKEYPPCLFNETPHGKDDRTLNTPHTTLRSRSYKA